MKTKKAVVCAGFCLLAANLSFAALIAQFNGTQIATTAGKVDTWINQGAGGDAQALGGTTANPDAVAMVMPNGTTHTVVDFDGIGNHLTMGSDAANYDGKAFTWTILFKNGDINQNGKNLLMNAYTETSPGNTSNANAVWGAFANSGNNVYALGRTSTGGFKGVATGTGTSDEWHIMSAKWDGSSRLYAWLDGSYLGNTTSVSADPSGHIRTRIGSNANGTAGAFFNGQIAEIRIYNESLSDAARGVVEDDLMNTYIIPEPATFGLVALMGGGLLFVRKRFAS